MNWNLAQLMRDIKLSLYTHFEAYPREKVLKLTFESFCNNRILCSFKRSIFGRHRMNWNHAQMMRHIKLSLCTHFEAYLREKVLKLTFESFCNNRILCSFKRSIFGRQRNELEPCSNDAAHQTESVYPCLLYTSPSPRDS